MSSLLSILKESFKDIPIIKKDGYYYFIHPLSDGIPILRPKLLKEVAEFIVKKADLNVDKILTIEAMGIPIATTVALMTDIPLVIVRKRKYELPGEIILSQNTGYSKGELYINDIKYGDRFLIIDDVISTGGTLVPLVKALQEIGAIINEIYVIIERGEGIRTLQNIGIKVETLIHIDVDENGVRVVEKK